MKRFENFKALDPVMAREPCAVTNGCSTDPALRAAVLTGSEEQTLFLAPTTIRP